MYIKETKVNRATYIVLVGITWSFSHSLTDSRILLRLLINKWATHDESEVFNVKWSV